LNGLASRIDVIRKIPVSLIDGNFSRGACCTGAQLSTGVTVPQRYWDVKRNLRRRLYPPRLAVFLI
jgi:hypothetical protein